ncbi:hypothetical protein ACH4PU_10660 [Streptomyces sp. NPDC021100]|uniref:hypothetical protein n=1 Tax=Streptomyces sp. NPDC021100 TaxID=3365114 RepID=UPI0037B65977
MDVLGPVIAVDVLAATVHDHTAGITLPSGVAEKAGGSTVGRALADQGFKTQVVTRGENPGRHRLSRPWYRCEVTIRRACRSSGPMS